MKKNKVSLMFLSLLFFNLLYNSHHCLAACDPTAKLFCNPLEGKIDNLLQGGEVTIQFILALIGTIALLFFIIAGIMYMTAAGEEEKIVSAKRMFTVTIEGLAIALMAFSILQVIANILG